MGVPAFFAWLLKKYKKNGFVFRKEKLENETIINEINSIDYFLIDANCLIHPVCFKVIAENPNADDMDKLENKMIQAVLAYLEKIISYVNPVKGFYLAIDGVAPVAKIKQQRLRRFKSVADKLMWDNIKKKHGKPVVSSWNNNAITPGTDFMVKLHKKILDWIALQSKQVIYSSCFTPAEGEHKLLQFIRNNTDDYSYVIYGLDADLIFLALSTNSDKIYLLREANELNKKESHEVLNYVSIKIMKDSIVSTIKSYFEAYNITNVLDTNNMVNDFIFMCYFLGNDFLPHIPSLDISHSGIEMLIMKYVETITELIVGVNQKVSYLLNNNSINTNFLSIFLNKLASMEEAILRDNYSMKKYRPKCDSSDPYDIEMHKIDNLQFKITDPIKLGSDTMELWRVRYYNYHWGVEADELESFSKKLVYHYMMGINWVTLYYFDKCPSWEWYYPFEYPPFISDIAKYHSGTSFLFNLGKPLKPFMQLLAVFPPQSISLIPKSMRKLITDARSSMAFMYPLEFNQDFINKHKHWMGIPVLPPLDLELIKHSYNKYKDELTPEEISRNIIMEIYKNN